MRVGRWACARLGNGAPPIITHLLVHSIQLQAPAAAPIFGSASTFGAGTGFGGFTGVAAKAAGEGGAEEEEGEEAAGPEEECAAEFKPFVQLDEVEVSTGEEEETCLMDM